MVEMRRTRDAYGETLAELGEENPDIVVLDGDLSGSTRTYMFAERFPQRFFNMGIAEQNLMGTAAGLAAAGKIPFASTFAIFATGRPFEQIRQSICYPNLNVKIAATHSGLTVGADGASHQALEDMALMRSLPNMSVVVPSDAPMTREVVSVIADRQGPTYLRLSRAAFPVLDVKGFRVVRGREPEISSSGFRWGEARVHLAQENAAKIVDGQDYRGDIAFVACGIMVSKARQAVRRLGNQGIDAAVVEMPTVKPLDIQTLQKVSSGFNGLITAEEHSIIGGLGSAVSETVNEQGPPVLVKRIGVQDEFGRSGGPEELLEHYGLTEEVLVEEAKRMAANVD